MSRTFRVVATASTLLTAGYLGVMAWHSLLRPEQVTLAAIFVAGFFLGPHLRRFSLAALPLALFGLVYDMLRLCPNYTLAPVDIEGLYRLEQQIFGIERGGAVLIPCEFFARFNVPALDLLAGLLYLNWVSVPAIVGAWLFFKNRALFLRYSWAFLLVNLIGFVIYYLHPAAPPWYVAKHGFATILGTPGDPAGLSRFDSMVGAGVFATIYSRNANVFAALPSLHCAYPVVALLYAFFARSRSCVALLAAFSVGLWFSAVYTGHHYVIDVGLGVACAIVGVVGIEAICRRSSPIRRLLGILEEALTVEHRASA